MRSAQRIVPYVVELTGCRSVVDVGCGIGTWPRAFIEQGVSDVVGVDFHEETQRLLIPPTCFRKQDLRRPMDLGRTFDLAVCLEVAEHLEEELADGLVDSLVRHAPIVLFGAAVPGQGGWSHINEQWPEYWAAKFRARGLTAVDCIRPRFWEDPQVDYWYPQNTVLYIQRDHLERHPALASAAAWPSEPIKAARHPRRLKSIFTEGVPTLLASIRAAVAGAMRRRAE
jgi:SAM-dependent methyltransferase